MSNPLIIVQIKHIQDVDSLLLMPYFLICNYMMQIKKKSLSEHLFTKHNNLKVPESVQPERIFHTQALR